MSNQELRDQIARCTGLAERIELELEGWEGLCQRMDQFAEEVELRRDTFDAMLEAWKAMRAQLLRVINEHDDGDAWKR